MPGPFSPASLAKSVHDTLAEAYTALPDGAHHALVLDATTDTGIHALYVERGPKGWDVALEGEWRGKGHAAGKVSLLWHR